MLSAASNRTILTLGEVGSAQETRSKTFHLFLSALSNEEPEAPAYKDLLDHLAHLPQDEIAKLIENPQFQHYLHRLVQHAVKHGGLNGLIEKLARYFPAAVADFKEKQLPISYSYSDLDIRKDKRVSARTDANKQPAVASSHPKLFRYDPVAIPATFRGQQVKLTDLDRAAFAVSTEIRISEKSAGSIRTRKSWTLEGGRRSAQGRSRQSGCSAQASANTAFRSSAKDKSKTKISSELSEISTLEPVLLSELKDPHFKVSNSGLSLFPEKERAAESARPQVPLDKDELCLKSIYDVIDAFASGKLKSESDSVYLNYTFPDKWHPYDLTVTLKTKVRPEHLVISKFGILFMHPDGESDFQTFAEWLREARMFTLVRHIPFFRDHKLKIAFHQWLRAVKFTKYKRVFFKIDTMAMRFLPTFLDALLKIKFLSEEFLTISFHHLIPLGAYSVEAFEHNLHRSQDAASQYLFKYFKYCKRLVCGTMKTVRSRAIELKVETQNQPFVSELPLSIQRKNHENLKGELKAATYRRDKLGDFVILAEQIVYSCLLESARQAADSWKRTLLVSPTHQVPVASLHEDSENSPTHTTSTEEVEEKFFLLTSLILDKSGEVTTNPDCAHIEALLLEIFQDTLGIITEVVSRLDDPENRMIATRPSTIDTPMTPMTHFKDQTFSEASTSTVPKMKLDLPPSFASSKQPKSLMKALKGVLQDTTGFTGPLLASQTAKNQLALLERSEVTDINIEDLVVRHSVLDQYKCTEAMENDEHIKSVMEIVGDAVKKSCEELKAMCQQHHWLSDMWKFIQSWKGDQQEFNMRTNEFEDTLGELHRWHNQFKSLPSQLLTHRSILCISSSSLKKQYLPMLVAIQDQIKFGAIKKARRLCEKVLEETKKRAGVLSSKRYDLEGFADYAHYLRESQLFRSEEFANISFVLDVHLILQRQGIQVLPHDKELGRKLQDTWREFESVLAEAEEFVKKQTPIKDQGLLDSIKSCEEELQVLVNKINQDEFVDPSRRPSEIVALLKRIQEEVSTIHSRMLGLSKWKEAITGLPHDLSNINSLLDQVYVRQELWKYRGVFDSYEREWMKCPFKSLDINILSNKVSIWLEVCAKLVKILPMDDPVLSDWKERLSVLKKGLPLLTQLSSKALKASHWFTIFAALGEVYDPSKQYTLTDFSLFNIYEHANIIFEICHDAMQEDKLKSKVCEMSYIVELQTINVVEIPAEKFGFIIAKPGSSDGAITDTTTSTTAKKSKGTAKKFKGTEKTTSFAFGFVEHRDREASTEALYLIENNTEILAELENAMVELKMLVGSPHIGHQKTKAVSLLDTFSRLIEHIDLLTQCQNQWHHMVSLLKQAPPSLREELGLTNLQKATTKFQEIIRSIQEDPRLLSLMEKRRGQKGFRELQGESLRHAGNVMLKILSEVMYKVMSYLDKSYGEFPRLFYLSDKDMLALAGNRGDPIHLIPIISKLFPAIKNIRFTEVEQKKNISVFSSSDSIDEGLQIVSLDGWHDEHLFLVVPLPLGRKPTTKWLIALEYAISYSLSSSLNETYSSLPDVLKGNEHLAEWRVRELVYWIIGHLDQCVLLSMELHWTLVLHSALTSDDPIEQMKSIRTRISTALESLSDLFLKWRSKRSRSTDTILLNLISLLRCNYETTLSLMSEEICTPKSFHWKMHIHYSSETENLYTVHDDMAVMRTRLGSVHGKPPANITMESKDPTEGPRNRSISVASTRTLLQGCNDTALANVSNIVMSEQDRSAASSLFSKISGSYPPLKCFVHCHRNTIPYAFEFLGSDTHLTFTPQTEKSLLSLVNAMATHNYPLINSASCSSYQSTAGKDLAVILGRHFYAIDCCLLSSPAALQRLILGAVHTGSQLQLNNFHCLPELLMGLLTQLLETLAAVLIRPSPALLQSQRTRVTLGISSLSSSTLTSTTSNIQQRVPELRVNNDVERFSSDSTVQPLRKQPAFIAFPGSSDNQKSNTANAQSSAQNSRATSQQSHSTQHQSRPSTSRGTSRLDWYQSPNPEEGGLWYGYGGDARRSMETESGVIQVSPAFGCVLVGKTAAKTIPEQLKSLFRSIDVMQPEMPYLAEALLSINGFSEARAFSCIIPKFLQHLKHQLLSSNPAISSFIGIPTLKQIIEKAAKLFAQEKDNYTESNAIVKSIEHYFAPMLTVEGSCEDEGEEMSNRNVYREYVGWKKLRDLLEHFFPSCDVEAGYFVAESKQLLRAVKMCLDERHFQCNSSFLDKILQVHLGLQHSKCVLLTGPCGSGKTTSFNVLAAAYQHMNELHALASDSSKTQDQEQLGKTGNYNCVNIITINPQAYSLDELFGFYKDKTNCKEWCDGILTVHLRQVKVNDDLRATALHPDANEMLRPQVFKESTPIAHWLVLDGPLEPLMSEILHQLVSDEGIILQSGERISLPRSCQLIIETPSLDHVTPFLLSASSLIHFDSKILSFDALVNTWLDRAPTQHNLSATSTETLAIMIKQLLPETLEYLTNVNTKYYGSEYTVWNRSQVYGLTETQCFLSLLSAVLERNAPKGTSSSGYSGNISERSSRSSSRMSASESRASSVMLSHSTSSMQTDVSLDPLKQDYDDDNDEFGMSGIGSDFELSFHVQLAAMLSFAYIWSLGAFVPFNEANSFSDFARDLIMQLPYAVHLPEDGSIFDYFLDLKMYQFNPWKARKITSRRATGGYIATPELERLAYISDLYFLYGLDVIITGLTGTGKTSFVNNLLKSRLSIIRIPITCIETPLCLQSSILTKLAQEEKKTGQKLVGSSRRLQRKVAFVLDDIHLAPKYDSTAVTSCTSPILELVTFMVSNHKLVDFARGCDHILNSRFAVITTPGDYWRLPTRLTRKLCRLPFFPPSDECLHQVFSRSIELWLQAFPSIGDVDQVINALSVASVTVYRSISDRFQHSSSSPHLLITMHDLMNVYQGLLLLSPGTKAQAQPQFSFLNRRGAQSSLNSQKSTKSGRRKQLPGLDIRRKKVARKKVDTVEATSTIRMLIRLWCHETTRVYLDRNTDSKDHVWFSKLLETCIQYCFCGINFGVNPVSPGAAIMSRQSGGGRTANAGRHIRGNRARGGALPQHASAAEGLNAAELKGNGVKVETLKKLMLSGEEPKESPPKLISLDQVTVRGEDLTGLLFAQFPKSLSSSQVPSMESAASVGQEEGSSSPLPPIAVVEYAELGDGQVMEILSSHLKEYQSSRDEEDVDDSLPNEQSGSCIVLYRKAIEHCARLCRVMKLPGAHALLIGTKGGGRKSLIRLMTYILKFKLIDISSTHRSSLRKQLREACISAAVGNQNTLLVVSNQTRLSTQEWDDIVNIMSHGYCEGLFTSSEVLVMSGKLPGGKLKRTAHLASQAFSRAVRAHLQVLVLWNTDSVTGSLFSANASLHEGNVLADEEQNRALFQSLFKCCSYVDHYMPWSRQAYSDIAIRWWQQDSSAVKWQDWVDTSSQLEAVGCLAAHAHITTADLLSRMYGESARHLISPKVFIDCLTMAQNMAVKIKQEVVTNLEELQFALKELEDVDDAAISLEQELTKKASFHRDAEDLVSKRMESITEAKERYMAAHKCCKQAEEIIQIETENVQKLSKELDRMNAEVRQRRAASLSGLSGVTPDNVIEVSHYREPPESLLPVFYGFCVLFDRPQSWEECQVLLMSDKFHECLTFFDRDNVSARKLREISELIHRNRDSFDNMASISKVVVPFSTWLLALVDYNAIKASIMPTQLKLKRAEENLENAKRIYVEKQKEMMETKEALEDTIRKHQDSIKSARGHEKDTSKTNSKLEQVQKFLTTMSPQRKKWEAELKVVSSRLNCVPGHVVLCAAGVCYLSRVPPDMHKMLWTNWLGYCSGTVTLGSLKAEHGTSQGYGGFSGQQQVVGIQKDFSLANHLSTKEERSLWKQEGTFPDESILERSLASRCFCTFGSNSWPLVFDPYSQFEKYLIALMVCRTESQSDDAINESNTQSIFSKLKISDPSLIQEMKIAMTLGKTVMLSVDEPNARELCPEDETLLSKAIQRDFTSDKDGLHLYVSDQLNITVNPKFQLFLVIHRNVMNTLFPRGKISYLNVLGMQSISNGGLIDIELRNEALQSNLQWFVITHERPEYEVRYKSLLTDLTHHEQELEKTQRKMLDHVSSAKDKKSLLNFKDTLDILEECEMSEATSLDLIRETKKNLEIFDQQALTYKIFSHQASIFLSTLQKFSSTLQYFSISIDKFKKTLADLILNFKRNKVNDHALTINARILHLQKQLLLSIYHQLQMNVFERHQLLFPLMIGIETQLKERKITDKEVELLGANLGGLGIQLDLINSETERQQLLVKPQWTNDKSWSMAMQLQKEIPDLRRLAFEISNSSNEWEEYFETTSSIMAPVPGMGNNCSLGQKLLIWKVFKPEKFYAIVKDFILITVGAEFIITKPPSLDEVFFYTDSQSVTLLLQSGDDKCNPTLAEIEELALKHKLGLNHFLLNGDPNCETLFQQLPQLAAERCWILVENCHLLTNCLEILKRLMKKVEGLDVFDHFRLWVLMPLEYICKHPIVEYKTIIFQKSKMSDECEQSIELLQDLPRVLSPSTHTSLRTQKHVDGSWSGYDSIISMLDAFIPPALSDSELSDLDPQQENLQSLPSLIYEELCLHNQSIASLHASLELVSSFLNGETHFSALIGQDLLCIADDVIPSSWHGVLPKPLYEMTSLISAVKLIKSRLTFYRRVLQSGTLPTKLNPLLFSSLQDLLSRMLSSYAAKYQLDISSVIMEGRLAVNGSVADVSEGINFPNLTLHGAVWDEVSHCLVDPSDTESTTGTATTTTSTTIRNAACYSALISFRHEDDTAAAVLETASMCDSTHPYRVYECPVKLKIRSAENVTAPLFHIPLPLSVQLTNTIDVHLLCDLET